MSTSLPSDSDSDDLLPLDPRSDALVDLDGKLQLARMLQEFASEEPEPVIFRQWEIEAPLGSGGMGKVYLARHLELGRRVALKLVRSGPGIADQAGALRLIREAQALAQIDHPSVLRIHQIDSGEQPVVIEMEYVEGQTLQSWQGTAVRSWRELVSVYADVGDGLAAIHAAGLLHRDIKPANLLVDDEGHVKVVDLGLAVAMDRARGMDGISHGPARDPQADRTTQRGSLLDHRLTAAGARVGTLGYMAPEVIVGGRASQASDEFSLATALYEAVCGTLPFIGETPRELAHAIETGELAPPSEGRRAPGRLRRVLRRALSFDPDRRFGSVAVFVARLRWVLGLRRMLWGALGVLVLASSVVSATWLIKPEPLRDCEQVGDAFAATWTVQRRPHFEERAEEAPDTAARSIALFIDTVDTKVEALAASETQLCLAERSPTAELDTEQAACLRYARAQLEAVTRELDTLEAETYVLAQHHVEAARVVEALPTCALNSHLAHWHGVALDEGLDEALAEILALETAGVYAEAERRARELLDGALSLDPLRRAEARYRLGHVLGTQRQAEAAYEQLDLARNLAVSINHDELMCRAVVFQAKLAALVQVDPETAARELGLAEACVASIDARSPLLRADLHEGRGLLASAAGAHREAERQHRAAMKLRVEYLGREHGDTAKSMLNLANALTDQLAEARRDNEARALYRESLELRARLFGPRHSKIADAAFDLAEFERSRGALESAREQFALAESIYADTPDRALVRAKIQLAIAAIVVDEEDFEAAELALGRAKLRLTECDAEVGAYERATWFYLDGVVALQTQDFRRAADSSRRGAALYHRFNDDGNEALGCVVIEIEANYGLQDLARIAALARDEGPALAEHLTTLDAANRGALAWYVGEALLDQGPHAEAAAYFRLALSTYIDLEDESSQADLRQLLARAEAKFGPTPSPETTLP